MQPEIRTLSARKLVGKRIRMSYSNNRTSELWRSFMPRRKEIRNTSGSDLYSLEVYEAAFFDNFNSAREYDKWAAIAVTDFNAVPPEMEKMTLSGGLYAVFLYRGPASAAANFYQAIFAAWLPNSAYILDQRPHLAIMGAKYQGEDPASEEEIWIPIQPRVGKP
jgi:AraC family transcriptional regulator